MGEVSSTNQSVQKVLEQYRSAVENVVKFFADLGVNARAEVVTGSQLRSFFVKARRDLDELDLRYFIARELSETVTSIIAEYLAGGSARTIMPIIVDRYGNVIAGYTLLELVRENRNVLDTALFVVYRTDLDMSNDVDFVKAVLIWLLTDYLALAKHVAPYVYSLDGREVRLGLEHFAVLLMLYIKAQIGNKVLAELPPPARALVGDMFEKVLSDRNVRTRLSELAEALRVVKHGRYIPGLSFLVKLEPLLTFIEKAGKEVKVEVAKVVAPARVEAEIAELEKRVEAHRPVEKALEKPLEERKVPEVREEGVEELAERVIETVPEVEAEVEEERPAITPRAEVYVSAGSDGIPRLCIRCPSCGYVHSDRARYRYDLDLEFRCPKCGYHETISRAVLNDRVRTFIASNVKATLEVVDVTVEGIRGRCPLCGSEIPPTDESTYVTCRNCGLVLIVPSDAFEKLQKIRDENPLTGTVISLDASRIVVKCPYCGHENAYTRLEHVREGCRVTCRNCSYTFKIPEDRYSEWASIRKTIEDELKELYEVVTASEYEPDRLSDLTLRLTADSAKLEIATKIMHDVLGSFDRLRSFVKGIADKVEELYGQAVELKRSGDEEAALEKLKEARRLQKILEAIASRYGTIEFEQDYSRVTVILDPEKYVEERLRTEIADAYTRYNREIRDLLEDVDELVKKHEEEEKIEPRDILHAKRALIDNIVVAFSKVYSMLHSPRDIYGLRQELERERATVHEKVYSLVKTVLKNYDAELDTVVSAVAKIVDFFPVVLPVPNMLATEVKMLVDTWKSKGIHVSQTAVYIAALAIGLALLRRLKAGDVRHILTMLDPAYSIDGALAYALDRVLAEYEGADEIIVRYFGIDEEKLERVREYISNIGTVTA